MTTTPDYAGLIARLEGWDRCYPGNINIELAVDKATQALSTLLESNAALEGERDEFRAKLAETIGKLMVANQRVRELETLSMNLEAEAKNAESERDRLAERVALEFKAGSEVPDVARGNMEACIIMMRSRHTGKNFTMPAYYLNSYPLEFEDGCGDPNCEDMHDDGCPVTGWFYDNANFEYENCYYRIEGECLAWALIPDATVVESAIARSLVKGGGDE
jgi:hypothetical protein